MAGSKIPPQAYTKDTLTKAYDWLKNQPDSVKSKAQCADSLVSLYLHSLRHGDNAIYAPKAMAPNSGATLQTEAPASAQNFKSDLKDLAEGLKKFEEVPVTNTTPTPYSIPNRTYTSKPRHNSPPQHQVLPAQDVPSLDERSVKMLKIVQDRFNFSTETEALRMIITLGFEQVEKTFPQKPPTA